MPGAFRSLRLLEVNSRAHLMGVTSQVLPCRSQGLCFSPKELPGRYSWLMSWIAVFGDLSEIKWASKYSVCWALELLVARKMQ